MVSWEPLGVFWGSHGTSWGSPGVAGGSPGMGLGPPEGSHEATGSPGVAWWSLGSLLGPFGVVSGVDLVRKIIKFCLFSLYSVRFGVLEDNERPREILGRIGSQKAPKRHPQREPKRTQKRTQNDIEIWIDVRAIFEPKIIGWTGCPAVPRRDLWPARGRSSEFCCISYE